MAHVQCPAAAPGNGLAVAEPGKVVNSLKRMGEGVSQIERAPDPLSLLGIPFDIAVLNRNGEPDHLGKHVPLTGKHRIAVLYQKVIELGIFREQRMLQHLSKAGDILTLRKRSESVCRDQDILGRVEGTDEVLRTGIVDGGLAAHCRINHRKQGRGNQHKSRAPHVERGGKCGHVAYDTSAEGDEDAVAGKT